MNTDIEKISSISKQLNKIYNEYVTLSGFGVEKLSIASEELNLKYHEWLDEYEGPEIENFFGGFNTMLSQRPIFVENLDESSLQGLSLTQLYLAWGFSDIEHAILEFEGDDDVEKTDLKSKESKTIKLAAAVNYCMEATKALTMAKHLLGKTDQECLI